MEATVREIRPTKRAARKDKTARIRRRARACMRLLEQRTRQKQVGLRLAMEREGMVMEDDTFEELVAGLSERPKPLRLRYPAQIEIIRGLAGTAGLSWGQLRAVVREVTGLQGMKELASRTDGKALIDVLNIMARKAEGKRFRAWAATMAATMAAAG